MKPDLDFAYAQARIQARFAALPQEAEWQRLAASRTLASFLEDARAGSLRDWVKGFSSQSGVHDLEAGIRSLHRENLEEITGLVPATWREAVSWVRWLVLLPLLAHLQTGGKVPGWARGDPLVQALTVGEGELDMRRLKDAGAQSFLESEGGLVAVWIAEWHRRWPRCSSEASRALEALRDLLMAHLDAFPEAPPESAWRLRGELREILRLRFHRQVLQPVVPFIYLALLTLDLERLRAALVTRALFPEQDEPAWPQTGGRAAA